MRYKYSQLRGMQIHADDGFIGSFEDVYFGDRSWQIRYHVVDLNPWQPDRRVLLEPSVFGSPDPDMRNVRVLLNKEQIRNSPPTDFERPVSQQHTAELQEYYKWKTTDQRLPALVSSLPDIGLKTELDTHLRSLKEIRGYTLEALDGILGTMTDFIFDNTLRQIPFAVVTTGAWADQQQLLVARQWMDWISYAEKYAGTPLMRQDFRQSPVYDPALPVTGTYVKQLQEYYMQLSA